MIAGYTLVLYRALNVHGVILIFPIEVAIVFAFG